MCPGPDVPDARHRRVTGRGLVSPVGPNLEQIHRLPDNRIPDIQHGADLLGRTATLHEPLQRGEVCGSFEIGEGHGDAGGDGRGIGGRCDGQHLNSADQPAHMAQVRCNERFGLTQSTPGFLFISGKQANRGSNLATRF